MEYKEIFVLISIVLGFLAYFAITKSHKSLLIICSLSCLFLYSLIKEIYVLSSVIIIIIIIFLFYYYKLRNKNFSIRLVQANPDNAHVVEFLKTYKRDIYSIFPFYKYNPEQKFFLIFNGNKIIGIFICRIQGDVLIVEVDYTKPIYRDLGVGNYIYNKNPGYFKNLGINRIISESFHKEYSRSLKKLGFRQEYIENKQFYVKYFD